MVPQSGLEARSEGQSPLVTVLITNHNYGRYLRQAVDSALQQTYPHVDVLVVDDGSTDDSRAVIAGYGDRLRVLLRKNGGQARAVNSALPLVAGDILFVLDADDWLYRDTVSRVVNEFTRDAACVRVQFRLDVCRADGHPTGATRPPRGVPLVTGDLRTLLASSRGLRWPPTSGNAWLVSAVRQVPPIAPEAFHGVDRWWGDLVGLLGTVRALPDVGGSYRLHGSNYSISERRDVAYFHGRIGGREVLHRAGVEVAARAGVPYPADPDHVRDAGLSSWRLAVSKLDQAARGPGPGGAIRALAACLRQPGRSASTRMAHAVWYAALFAAPAGGRAAQRLVELRYGPGAGASSPAEKRRMAAGRHLRSTLRHHLLPLHRSMGASMRLQGAGSAKGRPRVK